MSKEPGRRDFLRVLTVGSVGYQLPRVKAQTTAPLPETRAGGEPTVGQAIDLIMEQIPGERHSETVDTVKIGDPSRKLSGIATTFLPSCEVIRKTASFGANLLITHEPTFFNHLDETDWLEQDPVYRQKRALLEKHEIVVWRFHDYWHQHRPDGILQAVLERMQWEESHLEEDPRIVQIPDQDLESLAREMKLRLNSDRVQFVGDPALKCKRVGVLPGAYGGRSQIEFLGKSNVDVIIVGEINEWETSIYAADASCLGHKKALIILGHAESEEPGMAYLVPWLRRLFPEQPIRHIPLEPMFHQV